MRAWTPEEYNAAPVNYDVLQHPGNGLLYAANNYGVLEFDGVTWRLIEMPNGGVARTLAIDAQGTVWVGGTDEIARLVPDARGALHARSVLDQLPAAERAVGSTSAAASTPQGVYFAAGRRIFRFAATGTARTWSTPKAIASLISLGTALHVATAGGGAFMLAGENLTPTAGPVGPILAARAQPDGSWHLLTPQGPARWTGPGAPVQPLGAAAAAFFDAEPAHSGVFLADGRMAFGRVLGGVAILHREGNFLQKIDRTHGLPSNRVEQLCEDAEGGLWIAQRAGLARVQLDSPFAIHGVAQGVDGRPRALQRHAGRLYIAHNEGAAWRDDATGQFHAIGGLATGLSRFVAIGARLFGTSNAVYEVSPETVTPLIPRGITPLVALPGTPADRPWLIGGGSASAWLFAPEGHGWKTAGALAQLPADVASLVPLPDGTVWGASSDGRIWRMDFRGGPSLDAAVTGYGPEKGVPQVRPRDAELFLLGSEVLATSSAWILRYDAAADRFVPETRIAGVPPDATAIRAHADAAGTLWLQLGPPSGKLVRIHANGPGRWRAESLACPDVAGLVANRIYHDEAAQTLWVASQGALVSIDLAWQASRARPTPTAMVRRVETAARELIFGGSSALPDLSLSNESPSRLEVGGASRPDASRDKAASTASIHRLAAKPPLDGLGASGWSQQLHLDHRQSTLRFTFAAPAFDGDFLGRAQTQYRTRLDGLETEWTPWSADTVREFSNLPHRALAFLVEARGPDGRSGPAARWAFAIAPPWWLTPWALAGYVLAGIGSVGGVVRWRTQALRQRATHLEAIVAARTLELQRSSAQLRVSNTELARLHAIERDEKLAARLDEEKARLEMLRYQLNPHFLFNTLASICGTAASNPDATRTMAQRLANFCRLTLTRPDETDTVREEVRMLQSYLDIEKARWRDRLQIEISVEEETLGRRVPSFLLLPLLENAIKHGGRTTRGTLRLRMAIHAVGENGIAIEVANTGVLETATPHPDSTGIGLENLRRRLGRYYPAAHAFALTQEGEWVVARLNLSRSSFS